MKQERQLYSANRWAIVLAGGDGSRLRSFAKEFCGCECPKQFCPLIGEKPLIKETLERASMAVAPGQTVISLNRAHQCVYRSMLSKGEWLLAEQPENRGTAPAILHALMQIREVDPFATVALFPSDHYVSDVAGFMNHVDAAFEVTERLKVVAMLGFAAGRPEQAYGWIEPGKRYFSAGPELYAVNRFVEKPDASLAHALWRAGALWNSFVLAARVSSLLEMFAIRMPRLYAAFSEIRGLLGTVLEFDAMRRLYAVLPTLGFSEGVLQQCTGKLAVLPVRSVAWCDLGEPARVMETIRRIGAKAQCLPQ